MPPPWSLILIVKSSSAWQTRALIPGSTKLGSSFSWARWCSTVARIEFFSTSLKMSVRWEGMQ